MSMCFVSTDSGVEAEEVDDVLEMKEDSQGASGEAHFALAQFWDRVMEDIRRATGDDYKQQVLPLARVKKIMKLDEDVKMISAEAPLLFAKAAEIFIHELTLRAWVHTEDNKRRTLQRNDIAMAIIKSDQFDFLIDIVPRQEIKPNKARDDGQSKTAVSQDQVHYYFQLAQQHQAALQAPQSVPAQIHQTQAGGGAQQVVQVGASQQQQQQGLQIMQQVVTPGGEIQQIPIQLSQSQLNLIRMQMQSGNGQPIIIQASPVSSSQQPQLIQLSTVPQQQQSHPVYLTQVQTTQEQE